MGSALVKKRRDSFPTSFNHMAVLQCILDGVNLLIVDVKFDIKFGYDD